MHKLLWLHEHRYSLNARQSIQHFLRYEFQMQCVEQPERRVNGFESWPSCCSHKRHATIWALEKSSQLVLTARQRNFARRKICRFAAIYAWMHSAPTQRPWREGVACVRASWFLRTQLTHNSRTRNAIVRVHQTVQCLMFRRKIVQN